MKTAIVYYSKHHGNTKKLLDAIAAKNEVTLIDVTAQPSADLSGFDRIGFASGIYYNSFAKQLLSFAQEHLPGKIKDDGETKKNGTQRRLHCACAPYGSERSTPENENRSGIFYPCSVHGFCNDGFLRREQAGGRDGGLCL